MSRNRTDTARVTMTAGVLVTYTNQFAQVYRWGVLLRSQNED